MVRQVLRIKTMMSNESCYYKKIIMTSIDGEEFGSGFAAGVVSSLVSSGIQAISSTGGYYLDEDYTQLSTFGSRNPDLLNAMTIAAGGLSGGLSSTIAGGNFWAGARQGLITSGLNHVAHRMTVRSIVNARIDSQFEGTGMNPDDLVANTPKELLTEAIRLKETLSELRRLDELADFPGVELGRKNELNLKNRSIVIKHMRNPYTYRQLAITVGHELVHAYHVFGSTLYSEWVQYLNNNVYRAVDFSEVHAYRWELKWGGNINYGVPRSPLEYIKYHTDRLKNYDIFIKFPGNYY